ncbi:MAG: RNA polymerase sigma factor [Myxococcaceae bacterium]
MSVGAITLPRLIPTPPPPSAAEARARALVVRIQAGELGAFDELYQLTRADVARTLFHLVGRRAELEDLLQETYLCLLKAVKGFRGESAFRTFLYRVCANVALMHLRWWRRRPEEQWAELPDIPSTAANPEALAQAREAQVLVARALEKLTAKKRIVFVFHELVGLGPEEIAEAVGTSPNTVRSRLHYARLEFTEAMHRIVHAGKGGADGQP